MKNIQFKRIFFFCSPNSSAPSSRSTSPHRLTPDLGSQTHLGTRRPRSHNVSVESLNSIMTTEDRLQLYVPSVKVEAPLFYCPCHEQCNQKLKSTQLRKHIIDHHNVPIISIGQSSAEIGLPPRAPVENAFLTLQCDGQIVWIKLASFSDEYFIAGLLENSLDLSARYYLEVKVRNVTNEKILSKEIVSRCAIGSLEQHSWKVCFFLYRKFDFYCC